MGLGKQDCIRMRIVRICAHMGMNAKDECVSSLMIIQNFAQLPALNWHIKAEGS